ncbi:MAG: helix-turn-helix domain-containing protein, partial [Pseudonocardiaceae bacterium]
MTVADKRPQPRGRRPAGENTRAALLDAARVEFTERGFDGATVRAIAQRAGVDAAMVNHWFGGKDGLFVAALEIPVDPTEILSRILHGDPEQTAERILRTFLSVWDANGGGA